MITETYNMTHPATHPTTDNLLSTEGAPAPTAVAEVSIDELLQFICQIYAKLGRDDRSPLTTSDPTIADPAFDAAGESAVDRIEVCSQLLGEIDSTVDELRRRLNRAESLNHEQDLQLKARSLESNTDALTGLANRRSFEQQFENRCQAARNSHCPLVVAILDIDHFKAINDTRGHHVGDAVLRGLSKVLSADLPEGAFLARCGGEEFAILMTGIYLDQTIEIVDRLRANVQSKQFMFEGQPLAVTVSCGLAQMNVHDHRQQLMQRADSALYAAKQAGRNRTFWHDGQFVHLATVNTESETRIPVARTDWELEDRSSDVIDLSALPELSALIESSQSVSSSNHRTMRANWCDAAVLFWYLRQRLTEWTRIGSPFCVLAIDVDQSSEMARSYGSVALHFMMRAQMLHFDSVFRNMDVIARTCNSRVIVVMPCAVIRDLKRTLSRLRDTMDRFAYPMATELLEYSISIGITEVLPGDDPQQLVSRAEEALAVAQSLGRAHFVAKDAHRTWEIDRQNGLNGQSNPSEHAIVL